MKQMLTSLMILSIGLLSATAASASCPWYIPPTDCAVAKTIINKGVKVITLNLNVNLKCQNCITDKLEDKYGCIKDRVDGNLQDLFYINKICIKEHARDAAKDCYPASCSQKDLNAVAKYVETKN